MLQNSSSSATPIRLPHSEKLSDDDVRLALQLSRLLIASQPLTALRKSLDFIGEHLNCEFIGIYSITHLRLQPLCAWNSVVGFEDLAYRFKPNQAQPMSQALRDALNNNAEITQHRNELNLFHHHRLTTNWQLYGLSIGEKAYYDQLVVLGFTDQSELNCCLNPLAQILLTPVVQHINNIKIDQLADQLTNKLEKIINFSTGMCASWNYKSGWTYYNLSGFERLGHQRNNFDIQSYKTNNPMHPEDWQLAYNLFVNAVQQGTGYIHDYRVISTAGAEHWFHSNGIATEHNKEGQTTQIIFITQDITTIKRAEQALNKTAELEQWLIQYTSKIFQCTSTEGFTESLEALSIQMNLDRCVVRFLDKKCHSFALIDEWHRPDMLPLKSYRSKITDQEGLNWINNLIGEGKAFVCNNITAGLSSEKLLKYYSHIQIKAAINQPMMAAGELTGYVAFLKSTTHQWTDQEIRVAQVVANTIHITLLRNRRLDELKHIQERFQLAMNASTHGLWDVNIEANYLYLSPHFYSMLGYTEDELEASLNTILELNHPDDRHRLNQEFTRLNANKDDEISIQYRQRKKNGKYIWVFSRGKVLKRDSAGQPLRIIGVNTDVTELKNNEVALLKARQQAEQANRSKGEFLERMSHEIRTPMNAIVGMTYLILQTSLTTEQQNQLQDVDNAAKSLLRIIDDILDFSKIESGDLSIIDEEFDLNEEIIRVRKLIDLKAQQNGIVIDTIIPEDVPRKLIGDPHRLRQVITNLLSNAVKFTPEGCVSLSVQRADERKASEQISLLFSVSDSGIGLSKKQQEKLFDPYSQADKSTTRHFGGTGLGLSICKHLVEMMGGSIHVISLPNVGTTFHFTVVFKQPQIADTSLSLTQIANQEDSQQVLRDNFQGRRILLTEDNIVNQRVAQGLMKKLKINTVVANNGQEALDILKNDPTIFDAILMDIEMPILNGLDTTKAIRADTAYNHIPIIAMTAHVMAGDKERCLAAGMDDYVPKPINPKALQRIFTQLWDD